MLNKLRTSFTPEIKMMISRLIGHKNYTRFIILSRSRTGSNFLRGLLNSHKGIVCYSEFFKSNASIEWGFPGYNENGATLTLFQNDPVAFLDKWVYQKHPRHIEAVGFKLFYYHARDDKWSVLWPHLQNDTGIKIIHLKRKNILETHLSRQRAILTDKWANITGEKETQPAVHLNYEECIQDFVQTHTWERDNEEYFSQHPFMNIYYEDLAADYQVKMKEIQEFLDVAPEPVAPQTFKQASLPLSRSITNYWELKEKFAGTPWETFFADD